VKEAFSMKTLMVAVLSVGALVGCGGPGGQPFVGTWSSSGTFVSTYNLDTGAQTNTSQVSSSDTIAEGVTSGIVLSWNQCQIPAIVEGDIERALAL
jgi:hypothetical protein